MNHAQSMTRTQEATVQQNALQAAMLKASNEAAAKASNVTPIDKNQMVAIVPRVGILGEQLAFLPNTVNYDAGTIEYWNMKKGQKPQVAPLEFYKVSKPVDDKTVSAHISGAFAKEFGHQHILSRERLVKRTVQRDNEGNANTVDVEAYKERLIASITKAIRETM